MLCVQRLFHFIVERAQFRHFFRFLFVQKKRKTHENVTEEEISKVPHSFVMHKGDVGKSVLQLEMDMRHVMEPYTATKLKVI